MSHENENENNTPDTTPTDQDQTDTTVQATEEGGESGDESSDPDADALDAFSKGMDAADDSDHIPSLKDTTPKEPAADANGKDEAEQLDASKPKEDGDESKESGQKETDTAAEAKKTEADKKEQAETDAEVKELGLKGKSEERFRQMAGTIRDQAKEIEPLKADAARAQEWEDTIINSTATPEQFGSALQVIQAMNSEDPRMMGAAYESLLQEVQALGQKLGRDVPGVDPLQGHADLTEAVDSGDLDRKYAVEIAKQRVQNSNLTERQQETAQQNAQQQATQQAMQQVQALNDKLTAEDPDFARKLPYLQPTIEAIRNSVPPQQWPQAIERAYRQLPSLPAAPAPSPAPAPAPVGHMPLRPNGSSSGMRAKPKDDFEAFSMGVDSVGRG